MRKEKPPAAPDAPKKFAVPDSMRGFAPAEHVSDKHDPGEIIHYVAFEVTLGMTIDGFDKTARGAFCYFAAAELGLDHDAIVVTSVIPRSRDALEESSSVYVQGEVIVDSMMSAVMVAAALEDPELKLVDETMFGPCSVSNVRMSTKLAPTPSWQCNWSSETQAEPAARDAFADEPEVEAEFESPPSPSSKAEARRLERENELRAERVLAGRSAKAWAEKQLSMTSLEEPETAPEPSRAAPAKGSLLLCGDVDDEPAATAESSSQAQEERYCVAPPGRLGLRFDRAGGDDGHYVQGVDADSALLGSVGVDDVIVSVNGYPTSSLGPGAISTELEELENVERVLVLRAARKGWMRLPDMSFSQPPSAVAAGEPEPVAPSAPAEPASSRALRGSACMARARKTTSPSRRRPRESRRTPGGSTSWRARRTRTPSRHRRSSPNLRPHRRPTARKACPRRRSWGSARPAWPRSWSLRSRSSRLPSSTATRRRPRRASPGATTRRRLRRRASPRLSRPSLCRFRSYTRADATRTASSVSGTRRTRWLSCPCRARSEEHHASCRSRAAGITRWFSPPRARCGRVDSTASGSSGSAKLMGPTRFVSA